MNVQIYLIDFKMENMEKDRLYVLVFIKYKISFF